MQRSEGGDYGIWVKGLLKVKEEKRNKIRE